MTPLLLALGGAFWLGVLTSISPCPLATNIAAISYVGRNVGSPAQGAAGRRAVHPGAGAGLRGPGGPAGGQRAVLAGRVAVAADEPQQVPRPAADPRRHDPAGPALAGLAGGGDRRGAAPAGGPPRAGRRGPAGAGVRPELLPGLGRPVLRQPAAAGGAGRIDACSSPPSTAWAPACRCSPSPCCSCWGPTGSGRPSTGCRRPSGGSARGPGWRSSSIGLYLTLHHVWHVV